MNYIPDFVDNDEVPYQCIIRDMLNKVWQQPNPHEWQMKGIRKAFDAGTLMALHVPPGSGKTTVIIYDMIEIQKRDTKNSYC
jgi:superfamily II DNA or RNA helicase